MTAVSPGNAPKMIPRATPIKLAIIAFGAKAELKAAINVSSIIYLFSGKRDLEKNSKNNIQKD